MRYYVRPSEAGDQVARSRTSVAEWTADGTVTIFTPYLAGARWRLGRAGLPFLVLAGLYLVASIVRLAIVARVLIREIVASPDVGSVIALSLMTCALAAFLWFMWRWVTKGGTVVVADAQGIGFRISAGGRGTLHQRPTWDQVTDVRIETRGNLRALVYQSNYGATPFGVGLDSVTAARVAESIQRLRTAALSQSSAQA